jgi:Ca2+-binding RTX toxin-like protein
MMAGTGGIKIRDATTNAIIETIDVGDASRVQFAGNTVTIDLEGLGYDISYLVQIAPGVLTNQSGHAWVHYADLHFTTTIPTVFTGTAGNDTFAGGDEDNAFHLGLGGNDTATGGGGNDTFYLGAALNAGDRLNGGEGDDTLVLAADRELGDYWEGLNTVPGTLVSIETIRLSANATYAIALSDGNVAKDATLVVDGSKLVAGDNFVFNGSSETNGQLVVTSGAGNDRLTGGARDDALIGGKGSDTLTGGRGVDDMDGGIGADVFAFRNSKDSAVAKYDTIHAFDAAAGDRIDLRAHVSGVDAAIEGGALSTASFVNDLRLAVDAAHLGSGHAVLFTADSGDLAGGTYLVVDMNGDAGYQKTDLVVSLDGLQSPGALGVAVFI